MDKLHNWLSRIDNRRSVPQEQLEIVKSDLQRHVIGIQGGGMFTITYSILWHVR